MSDVPSRFTSACLNLEVVNDAQRNAALVLLSPIESWDDRDTRIQRDEAVGYFKDLFSGVRIEDHERDYQIVVPAPPGVTLEQHHQHIATLSGRFAEEHSFVLELPEKEKPDLEGEMVKKLQRRRERKEAWQQLKADVERVVRAEDIEPDKRAKYIMQFFKIYLQSRSAGKGRGGEEETG